MMKFSIETAKAHSSQVAIASLTCFVALPALCFLVNILVNGTASETSFILLQEKSRAFTAKTLSFQFTIASGTRFMAEHTVLVLYILLWITFAGTRIICFDNE